MSFLRTIGGIVGALDLPFGYTLTIWASGAIALNRFGLPTLVDAFAFLAGAVLAYLICAGLFYHKLGETVTSRIRTAALINVISIIAAAAVSVVSSLFQNPIVGYSIAGFVGTLTYIICVSVLVHVTGHLGRRNDHAVR